eukprot:sb/3461586/
MNNHGSGSDQVIWPNAMVIDHPNKNIYWMDANLHSIECISYEGKERYTITKHDTVNLGHPWKMQIFEDMFIWRDAEGKVSAANKFSGDNYQQVTISSDTIDSSKVKGLSLRLFHSSLQPMSESRCTEGLCKNLCLPVPGGYRCACSTGYRLYYDGETCDSEQRDLALVAFEGRIMTISLYPMEPLPNALLLQAPGVKATFWAIDYHKSYIYFNTVSANPFEMTIKKMGMSGGDPQILYKIVMNEHSAGGLSIDWVNDKIYWAQGPTVSVGDKDGTHQTPLLQKEGFDFGDIFVDPCQGHIYLAARGRGIYRVSSDGSASTWKELVVFNETKGLNGISFDKDGNKVGIARSLLSFQHPIAWIRQFLASTTNSPTRATRRRQVNLIVISYSICATEPLSRANMSVDVKHAWMGIARSLLSFQHPIAWIRQFLASTTNSPTRATRRRQVNLIVSKSEYFWSRDTGQFGLVASTPITRRAFNHVTATHHIAPAVILRCKSDPVQIAPWGHLLFHTKHHNLKVPFKSLVHIAPSCDHIAPRSKLPRTTLVARKWLLCTSIYIETICDHSHLSNQNDVCVMNETLKSLLNEAYPFGYNMWFKPKNPTPNTCTRLGFFELTSSLNYRTFKYFFFQETGFRGNEHGGVRNPCEMNSCSHLCLQGQAVEHNGVTEKTKSCTCPTGYALLPNSTTECADDIAQYLVYNPESGIQTVSLDTEFLTPVKDQQKMGFRVKAFDIDAKNNLVYYCYRGGSTDIFESRGIFSTSPDPVTLPIYTTACKAMAVEWVTRKLYIVDAGEKVRGFLIRYNEIVRYHLVSKTPHTSHRARWQGVTSLQRYHQELANIAYSQADAGLILVVDIERPHQIRHMVVNLQEPLDVVVHPSRGRIYWILASHNIMSTSMYDSSDIEQVVAPSKGSTVPVEGTQLFIDYATDSLYWTENVIKKYWSHWLITSSDWLFTCVGRFLAPGYLHIPYICFQYNNISRPPLPVDITCITTSVLCPVWRRHTPFDSQSLI